MTPELVELRLKEAATTLLCLDTLDSEGDDLVASLDISGWPEIIPASWEGRRALIVANRVRPTAEAVADMQEVFRWLGWLDPLVQEIVWRRALGQPWRVVAERAGSVRPKVWKRWKAGVVDIALRLKKGGKGTLSGRAAPTPPRTTTSRHAAKAQGVGKGQGAPTPPPHASAQLSALPATTQPASAPSTQGQEGRA